MYLIAWATACFSIQILLLCRLIQLVIIVILKLNSIIEFLPAVHVLKIHALATDLWQTHYCYPMHQEQIVLLL